jgi:hypothetical protein
MSKIICQKNKGQENIREFLTEVISILESYF